METKRVVVGMSGGVDSAAAALLLQQQGYEAIGCTLLLYENGETGGCGSRREVEDARTVAESLGMTFCEVPFIDAFRRCVMDDFVACYRGGRTPNPCIRCNRYVKFDALMEQADRLGAAHIATGHYARVRYDEATGRWQLLRGLDRQKDQSYVLYPLTQTHLSRLLLPVGEYEKPRIREMAQQRGMVNANKPDSQDICFVPDGDYTAFLQRSGVELVPGDFVDTAGRVLGRHRGLECYTTGQRRGLGVSADRPLYVLRKDAAANAVVLGDEQELYTRTVTAEDFNWVSLAPIREPVAVTAKTRYSQTEAAGTLYPADGDGRVHLVFEKPQRAVTAGQALVVYSGELVVGGGTIVGSE